MNLFQAAEVLTALSCALSVSKALDGRPRPQKQLSQPTLGASEHTEAARLRGSQSSEGPELIHSAPGNTSSPSSAAAGSDGGRDADASKPPLRMSNRTGGEMGHSKFGLFLRWSCHLGRVQDE